MAKTALLPGGFKPPHKGHYAIAKILSKEGDVLVRVGSGERDGITQDMSIKIWKIYGEILDQINTYSMNQLILN